MVDMAEGMSKAGTVASSYRVSVEDLSAMIGTMEAVTKSGGSEVGNAVKAILINLQNVTSDKMVKTLDAANASMTEFVDGTEKLRNP
ncbi:phage tail tape measure protein, partial [bacterium D16-59]